MKTLLLITMIAICSQSCLRENKTTDTQKTTVTNTPYIQAEDSIWMDEIVDRFNKIGMREYQEDNPELSWMIKTDYIQNQRKTNLRKIMNRYINVAKTVDKVIVDKTCDTGEYVITLVSTNGREVSFWMIGDSVRTITPY